MTEIFCQSNWWERRTLPSINLTLHEVYIYGMSFIIQNCTVVWLPFGSLLEIGGIKPTTAPHKKCALDIPLTNKIFARVNRICPNHVAGWSHAWIYWFKLILQNDVFCLLFEPRVNSRREAAADCSSTHWRAKGITQPVFVVFSSSNETKKGSETSLSLNNKKGHYQRAYVKSTHSISSSWAIR